MLLRGLIDAVHLDQDNISRILDVCQELKILSPVLDMIPFHFGIRLAGLASKKEIMDLENWLSAHLATNKDAFYEECLRFVKDVQIGAQDVPANRFHPPGALLNIYLEACPTVLKVLQSHAGVVSSSLLAEEMEKLDVTHMRANSRIKNGGGSDSTSDSYADDIEAESNAYFHQMFSGQLGIDAMIQMLTRFKESLDKREQSIFECMIGNLFEEYKFFSKYPERQLRIAAVLFAVYNSEVNDLGESRDNIYTGWSWENVKNNVKYAFSIVKGYLLNWAMWLQLSTVNLMFLLSGSLIKHQLVTHLTLGIALRAVLDALRKPADSKMFSFGTKALEQFVDRLIEWPQYCNHILQISHLRAAHADLVAFIERALNRISAAHAEPDIVHNATSDHHHGPIQSAVNMEVPGSSFSLIGPGSAQTGLLVSSPIQLPQRPTSSLDDRKTSLSNYMKPAQFSGGQPAIAPSSDTAGIQKARFGSALNIETLVAAAERRETPIECSKYSKNLRGAVCQMYGLQMHQKKKTACARLFGTRGTLFWGHIHARSSSCHHHALAVNEVSFFLRKHIPCSCVSLVAQIVMVKFVACSAPASEIQDKISFIINNLSAANVEAKAKEFTEILNEQYYPWFAQYMVMKRASIETNFHDLYLKFLDKVNLKALNKEIVQATYENCKVLLGSELIKSSVEERSLLKNLGSWLGKITIGKNQVLRAREIDPKSLIIEAYEKGLMIAVIPFTSKSCISTPNPWTMGILGLLAEIYAMPNLKMNLKFEIEVLFKNLGVEHKEVTPTSLLKDRVREVEGNPDFSNKDVGSSQPPIVNEVKSGIISTLNQVEVPLDVAAPPHAGGHSRIVSQYGAPLHHSSGTLTEDEKLVSLGFSDQPCTRPSTGTDTLPVPAANIEQQVVVNKKLQAYGLHLHFQSVLPIAMDRAVKEIVSSIVQRSVSIATQTTKELVLKDYAMEPDETLIRNAAHLMVARLAGSLAHVTCKEPLRGSISGQLRSSLQGLSISSELLEQAVQLVTNDNLDLGCVLIEQAATEKIAICCWSFSPMELGDMENVFPWLWCYMERHISGISPSICLLTCATREIPQAEPRAHRPKAREMLIQHHSRTFACDMRERDRGAVLAHTSNCAIYWYPTRTANVYSIWPCKTLPTTGAVTNTTLEKINMCIEREMDCGDLAAECFPRFANFCGFWEATVSTRHTEENMGQEYRGDLGVIAEVPAVILRCISRDEAALAVAQKVMVIPHIVCLMS
ncbi:UNVERIFIED_CONTAM: CCR4-NOT transcription complex subunit [Sesamum latifolium]|uniref:CCR4-NOT transcription complex subunit n=1 Tax=Sesamum latifolium TaxID=2727402 RepID=A0AAW2YG04_9LAMI